ncbi:rCG52954 [Rattus norvegicus]|uniref:RCG52954 n=1 Tax=Rattus norvegicus TaxID=10116 RepID=A6IQL9_RAT|nr:rCG52954 [Rattus norvegicus]
MNRFVDGHHHKGHKLEARHVPLGKPGPSGFLQCLEKVRTLEIPLGAKQQHKPKRSRDIITHELLDMSQNLQPPQLSLWVGK